MTTRDNRYTIFSYRSGRGVPVRDRIRLRPYEGRNVRLAPGTYIFADLERLPEWQRCRAARIARRLRAAGCRTLNDPATSLMRFDLLRALRRTGHQNLAIAREDDDLSGLCYPVFLRRESAHHGGLTDLLQNREELDAAFAEHAGAVVVEFVDTADSEGIYRKYSAFRLADRIVPRHMFFSRHWMQKQADLTDPKLLTEEREYVDTNPHEEAIREVFELARIEYGRIDYGMLNGRLQVWEINTNPSLAGPISDLKPEREAIHLLFARRMNDCFKELDEAGQNSGPLILNPNVWWRPPWLS